MDEPDDVLGTSSVLQSRSGLAVQSGGFLCCEWLTNPPEATATSLLNRTVGSFHHVCIEDTLTIFFVFVV